MRLACRPVRALATVAVLPATLLAAAPDVSPREVSSAETEVSAEVTPGWNLFSEQQDIQLGQEAATAFEAQVELVRDGTLDRYLVRLGDRLLQGRPDANYPFRFEVIADSGLHAFAFPGGLVYVTAGMLAAAPSEAQLAGLVAHQLAHIILRHPTSAASRKARFRIRAALAAASTGKVTLLESLAEIGLHIQPASELLRYEAKSEDDARALARSMLAASGYDPAESASPMQWLGKDDAELAAFFLERHPEPDDRDRPEPEFRLQTRPDVADAVEFEGLRARAAAIQGANGTQEVLVRLREPNEPAASSPGPREVFLTAAYRFAYPAAWKAGKPGPDERFQVAPKGGVIHLAGVGTVLAVGVISGTLTAEDSSGSATAALLDGLDDIRPGLTPASDQAAAASATGKLESVLLEGDSPIPGKRELAWAVSARRSADSDRVFYLLMIAPAGQFSELRPTFDHILESVEPWPLPESRDRGHE